MSGSAAGSLFEVSLPGASAEGDALGVWSSTPQPEAAGEAFGATIHDEVLPAQVWRAGLPANPESAQQALAEQERRLSAAEAALPRADRRLQRFIRQYVPGEAAAYTARPAPTLPHPERELRAWVEIANRPAVSGPLESYSFTGKTVCIPADFRETAEAAWRFLEDARKALQFDAWIETTTGGQTLARTRVSWNGDLQTAWRSVTRMETDGAEKCICSADIEHHTRVLEAALRTRAAWARMALLITRGAVQLAALFPTCPYLAIPAAWRFFRQITELAQAGRAI